jgi:uncharacterized protein involved in exopolysaccharide biosynthesis
MSVHNSVVEKAQTESPKTLPEIQINLLDLTRELLRRSRLIIAVTVAAGLVAAAVMLATPNKYTSHASVLPSGGSEKLGGIMGLAGSLGIGPAAGTDANSSALYPSILRSNVVRDGVLSETFPTRKGHLTMQEYFEIQDRNELRGALSRVTHIAVDKKLGVIRLGVETTDPVLSQAVMGEYLEQLEDYLINKRRSQAAENELYLERQQAQGKAELAAAEEELERFMKANRNWAVSDNPEIQTELARLKREVTLKSETYLLLTKQLEMARLDARKDVPIVRILDSPSLPTVKSGPARTSTTVFTSVLTFTLMILAIVVLHVVRQAFQAAGPQSVSELRREFERSVPASRRLIHLARAPEKLVRRHRHQDQEA